MYYALVRVLLVTNYMEVDAADDPFYSGSLIPERPERPERPGRPFRRRVYVLIHLSKSNQKTVLLFPYFSACCRSGHGRNNRTAVARPWRSVKSACKGFCQLDQNGGRTHRLSDSYQWFCANERGVRRRQNGSDCSGVF